MPEATVTTLISPDFVAIDVVAANRVELLSALADGLEAGGYVTSDYKRAVLDREVKFPTGLPTLGLKVAIPHADPEYVKKSFISVARLAQPVDFEEMGGSGSSVAADIVFMLAIADGKSQLTTLSALIGMFSQEDIMSRLRDAATSTDLFTVIDDEIRRSI